MVEWAQRAGKLVLSEAEDFHEVNVVTFCNLALFWHSQGAWKLSYLHKGKAAVVVADCKGCKTKLIRPRKFLPATPYHKHWA